MTITPHMTDHQVKAAVSAELIWTPSVNGDRIGVAVEDGAVTLSGQVDSYPEKEAAVHATLRVGGVRAVADELVVHHAWSDPDDVDIAREAAVALEHSVVVPDNSVKAEVHEHVVTLSGAVDWHYQREAARHSVVGLPGVKAVHNNITLKPAHAISATEAKAGITAAIVRHAQYDASRVNVVVTGSEIRLTGTVSSLAERSQAETAAWFARGVTHIDNQLTVNAFAT